MTNRGNPFMNNNYDLGTGNTVGVSKEDIDQVFRTISDNGMTCIYCGNTADYRIIPKHPQFNTAEIQDKGFMCEHCTAQSYLDKNNYGIRAL